MNSTDAHQIAKAFRGLANAEDIAGLEVGQAIAKIGTEVVRVRTPWPPPPIHPGQRERIIAASHRDYYARREDVMRQLRRRSERWDIRFADLSSGSGEPGNAEELLYDEFE